MPQLCQLKWTDDDGGGGVGDDASTAASVLKLLIMKPPDNPSKGNTTAAPRRCVGGGDVKFTAGRKWPEDVYPTIFAISVVIGCLYAVAQAGLQHSAAAAACCCWCLCCPWKNTFPAITWKRVWDEEFPILCNASGGIKELDWIGRYWIRGGGGRRGGVGQIIQLCIAVTQKEREECLLKAVLRCLWGFNGDVAALEASLGRIHCS